MAQSTKAHFGHPCLALPCSMTLNEPVWAIWGLASHLVGPFQDIWALTSYLGHRKPFDHHTFDRSEPF